MRICVEYVLEYVARLVSQSHIQVYSMSYSGESRDMHENMCGVCIGICREVSIPVTCSKYIPRDILQGHGI
jgi:hypothetical protein